MQYEGSMVTANGTSGTCFRTSYYSNFDFVFVSHINLEFGF